MAMWKLCERGGCRLLLVAVALIVGFFFVPAIAAADWTDRVELSGYLQSDVRYVVEDYRGAAPGEGYFFQMNRNDIQARVRYDPNENVGFVVDGRFRFYGFNETERLEQLTRRNLFDPYDFQLNEAYLALRDVPMEGMRILVGRKIQSWGTADLFNPTDNLNSRDFSDPLDYKSKVPNQMIEVDMFVGDRLELSAVFVPVFKPALLPPSASLAFMVEKSAEGCFVSSPPPPLSRRQLGTLQAVFDQYDPCDLLFQPPDVRQVKPSASLENSQVGVRTAARDVDLGGIGTADFSLSYYYGRFGFPVALSAVANLTPTEDGRTRVEYSAEVYYPRMQVLGADFSLAFASEYLPGINGEMALIFPEEVRFGLMVLSNNRPTSVRFVHVNVPSTPFVKATFGLDYTFSSWLYVNIQYVRGFIDEFNDAYGIHNYVVPALRANFFSDRLRLALAGVLSADDYSGFVYPEVTWSPFSQVSLTAGAWLFLGPVEPFDKLSYAGKYKFGQKAAGRNVAYLRARVDF